MRLLNDQEAPFKPAQFAVPNMQAQPQFNDPASFAVNAGPTGAKYLQEGAAPAPEEAPAGGGAALAMPPPSAPAQPAQNPAQASAPQEPEWMTPARKKMYEKAKRASQNYQRAVAGRRETRKKQQEYGKLYTQYENAIGQAEDLENLGKYSKLYPPEDARTMELVRMQARHVEKAERLQKQLRDTLRKSGVKIGDKDPLPDNPFGGADDNDGFDKIVGAGYEDALLSRFDDQP